MIVPGHTLAMLLECRCSACVMEAKLRKAARDSRCTKDMLYLVLEIIDFAFHAEARKAKTKTQFNDITISPEMIVKWGVVYGAKTYDRFAPLVYDTFGLRHSRDFTPAMDTLTKSKILHAQDRPDDMKSFEDLDIDILDRLRIYFRGST